MKINTILLKVYGLAGGVLGSVLLFTCILLGYDWKLCLFILLLALVMSAPPVMLLHFVFTILRKIHLSKAAAWIVLLSAVPLLAFTAARFFVNLIPGDTMVLTALGILSGYFGILCQGLSISELFNSFQYETE